MILWKQVKFYESCKLIAIFLVSVARHAKACQKCPEITNFQYLNKDLSYCFDFMQVSKVQWGLQINCHILNGRGQACPGIPKVGWNNNISISQQWLKLFFDFLQGSQVLWELQISSHEILTVSQLLVIFWS